METNAMSRRVRNARLPHMLLALFLWFVSPGTAAAQCEQPEVAYAAVGAMEIADITNINRFIQQEANFEWANVSNAFVLLSNAWDTFTTNVLAGLNSYSDKLDSETSATGLRFMTRELHAAQLDQTYRLGQLQDAQLMAEEEMRAHNHLNEAHTRYTPSELACAIDTTGPGLNRAYQISRALTRTLALDDQPRRENAVGLWHTVCDSKVEYTDLDGTQHSCENGDGSWSSLPTMSYNGKGQDVKAAYEHYIAKYCDKTIGDQGCTADPGPNAGRHKDIGALLWGPQLTIDPTNAENIRIVQDNLRFIIDPLAPEPIPETVIPKPGKIVAQAAAGRTGILMRRAESAYINAIYNVLGAMLSERIGGSKVDVSLMRAAAGIPKPDQTYNAPTSAGGSATSPTMPGTIPKVGASYREIQEAMTRDRFNDPQYLIKMLGNPEQVLRERNTLGALRLQTMNDIYRRQEELLFMEAAEYGRDLNGLIPRAQTSRKSFSRNADQH